MVPLARDRAASASEPTGGQARTWTTPEIVSPAETAAGGRTWPFTSDISVAWTSRDLRAVLVTRASGEPDSSDQVFFTRGSGLP